MTLVDTHILIWLLSDSSKLSDTAKAELKSGKKICVSIVSLWEIALKRAIGKLDISYTIVDIVKKCEAYRIDVLPIKPEHLDNISKLPDIHRDPFDRLMIAQAKAENMILLTADRKMQYYDEECIEGV